MVAHLYSKAELCALIFPLVSRVTEHLFMSPLISKGSFNNRESVTGPVTWASTSLSLPACSFTHLSLAVKHLIFMGFFSFFHSFFFLIETQKFIEVKELSREKFPFHQLL